MTALVTEKIAPLLALVIATVLLFAFALEPLYARGLAYSTSPTGALLHVPLIAVLALASWLVLVGWKKRTRAEVGLAWDERFLMELPVAVLVGAESNGFKSRYSSGLGNFGELLLTRQVVTNVGVAHRRRPAGASGFLTRTVTATVAREPPPKTLPPSLRDCSPAVRWLPRRFST